MTWRTIGRPHSGCNTFGIPERIRVPSPAARTSALRGRYCLIRAPSSFRVPRARGRGFEPRLRTPKDLVLPLHHPRNRPTIVPLRGGPSRSGSVASRHGIADQEAPQAHAQEEAQEAAEEDPLAASSAGQVSSDRPPGRSFRVPGRSVVTNPVIFG